MAYPMWSCGRLPSSRSQERFRLTPFSVFYINYCSIIMRLTHEKFRELAAKHGLAVTHQRQVVYEAVIASHGHHSPENIYASVRRRIPSISLATVYNNLRLFIECGLLREVTPHASTLRVDGNLKPHHHLVCSHCKSVQDIEGEFIDFNRLSRQLPDGFDLTQPLIEVFGLCRRCSAKT
jgi:Fur family peroxide stress response transcriptional regulator